MYPGSNGAYKFQNINMMIVNSERPSCPNVNLSSWLTE